MGCDIHAMIEKKWYPHPGRYRWKNAGDPLIERHYGLFAVLADIRNYGPLDIAPISSPRGIVGFKDEFPTYLSKSVNEPLEYRDIQCEDYKALVKMYGEDGHSHSCIYLRELKEYDRTGTVEKEFPEVLDRLIAEMGRHGPSNDVRLSFFFDN